MHPPHLYQRPNGAISQDSQPQFDRFLCQILRPTLDTFLYRKFDTKLRIYSAYRYGITFILSAFELFFEFYLFVYV